MYKICLILGGLLLASTSCDNAPTNAAKTSNVAEATPQEEEIATTTSMKKSILFFGDSLTAGYGLDEEESFPSLIQHRIDSLDMPYEVINAGLSGETSAGGKGRIDWVLNKPVDIFVLELGANDVLRGLNLDETNKNLRDILKVFKERNPDADIIIAGMEAPPNMGSDYTNQFRNIFKDLAEEYSAGLIPFLLDGVAGIPDLNLGDAKHPNAKGQHIVMDNVWQVLQGYLSQDPA